MSNTMDKGHWFITKKGKEFKWLVEMENNKNRSITKLLKTFKENLIQ